LRSLPHPWHPCCPDLPRHPCRPKGRTGQRPMVNHVFVTNHSPTSSACCLASDADPLRCASEERYWRYRTALAQQGCSQHRAGDGLASRMARGRPVASAPPPDAINSVPFSSRVIFDRPWRRLPELRMERRVIMVRELQCIHDQNSSARVGELVHQAGHSQRELVHRWSMLSLSAAPPRRMRPVLEGSPPACRGASRGDRISEMASGSNAQRLPHALLLGRWVISDEHVVDHRSLARSAPWAGRVARWIGAARVPRVR
jgi:hypothetical protein